MLDFLIDNIFVTFGGRVFQQTVAIALQWEQIVPTCFFINIWGWLYTGTSKKKDKKLAISFNLTFRYIDILSLNYSKFGDYVERICSI